MWIAIITLIILIILLSWFFDFHGVILCILGIILSLITLGFFISIGIHIFNSLI